MVLRSAYLGLLGLVFVLTYRIQVHGLDSGLRNSVTGWASVGQELFEWTLLFMLLVVLFLGPGATAGSIVGERQRQTLMPVADKLVATG